jgi:hypothetical protein
MNSEDHSSCRPVAPISLCLLLMLLALSLPSLAQDRRSPTPDLGLEIILPNNRQPLHRLGVFNSRASTTLILREYLTISDPKTAGNFTAVDVRAEGAGNAVKVRLSIIYNDLSQPEWWKHKKEKIVGAFLIQEGSSVRVAEMATFGIEPLEMKAVDARTVVFQPGEGPRIINNTKALVVVRLERRLDDYLLWLQNSSSKNIVAYSLSFGNGGLDVGGVGYGNMRPLLAAGAISAEEHLSDQNIESRGITIRGAIFEDGSFEGDAKFAAQFMARREGIRLQAPLVLAMIKEALAADDSQIQAEVERLEARLWVINEAMDKQSALELLKSKFTSFDEETLSGLYENLKGGFYEARNIALSPIGEARRRIQEEDRGGVNHRSKAKLLREMLIRLRENFESIVEG